MGRYKEVLAQKGAFKANKDRDKALETRTVQSLSPFFSKKKALNGKENYYKGGSLAFAEIELKNDNYGKNR